MRGCQVRLLWLCNKKEISKCPKKMKEFTIAIMDYSNASIKVFKRTLPSDIQSDDEELDKILTANGYKQSDCYFMLAEKINILNEV